MRSLLLISFLAATAIGCGDDSSNSKNTAGLPQEIVGSWTAAGIELVIRPDSSATYGYWVTSGEASLRNTCEFSLTKTSPGTLAVKRTGGNGIANICADGAATYSIPASNQLRICRDSACTTFSKL